MAATSFIFIKWLPNSDHKAVRLVFNGPEARMRKSKV
jgi:hypothetical protein